MSPEKRTGRVLKSEAGYVDQASWAKDRKSFDDQCSTCMHIIPRDRDCRCQVVNGPINPMGWCEWYEELPNNLKDVI